MVTLPAVTVAPVGSACAYVGSGAASGRLAATIIGQAMSRRTRELRRMVFFLKIAPVL
jgi:hypothetical protein